MANKYMHTLYTYHALEEIKGQNYGMVGPLSPVALHLMKNVMHIVKKETLVIAQPCDTYKTVCLHTHTHVMQ